MTGGTRSSRNVRAGVRFHNAIMRVFSLFAVAICFGWQLVAGSSAFVLLLFLLLLLSRLEAGSWQLVASWMLSLPFAVS